MQLACVGARTNISECSGMVHCVAWPISEHVYVLHVSCILYRFAEGFVQ